MDRYPEDVQPDPLWECAGCLEYHEDVVMVDDVAYCHMGHRIVGKVSMGD